MVKHKLGLLALLLTSCSSVTKEHIKTVDDIAHEACGYMFAKDRGISFQDAAEAFCVTEDQLRPFVTGLLKAEQRAKARAGMMVR